METEPLNSRSLFYRELHSKCGTVSKEETLRLIQEVRGGSKEAFDKLVLSNMRLVHSVATKTWVNLELMDRVQFGVIGLIRAIQTFDPSIGAAFSTYAVIWIRQAIGYGAKKTYRLIRLPSKVIDDLRAIRRAERVLGKSLGRAPMVSELAEETNIPVSRITRALQADVKIVSLDGPSVPSGDNLRDMKLQDMLLEPAAGPEDCFVQEEAKEMLLRELDGFKDKRVREIMLERNDDVTLEELGQRFNVTRERIRQIEAQALNRLRKRLLEIEEVC